LKKATELFFSISRASLASIGLSKGTLSIRTVREKMYVPIVQINFLGRLSNGYGDLKQGLGQP
jgi:hypothetical protein